MGKVAINWVQARSNIVVFVSGVVMLLVSFGKLSPAVGEELKAQFGSIMDWVVAGVALIVVFGKSLSEAWKAIKAPSATGGEVKPPESGGGSGQAGFISLKACVAIAFLLGIAMLTLTTLSGCKTGAVDANGNPLIVVPPGVECTDGVCTVNESALDKIIGMLSGDKKKKDSDKTTSASKTVKRYWSDYDGATSVPIILRAKKPPEK